MRLLTRLFLALAAMITAIPATAAPPVQVMVLGAYHFGNPGQDLANVKVDDVLAPQRQAELAALADALATWKPTKIMVERVVDTPDLVDPNYAAFTPADLTTKRNEREQIAYRLANRLGLKEVYGIDEQPGEGEPDYFPWGKVMEWAKANGEAERLDAWMAVPTAEVKRFEGLQATHSIPQLLAIQNAAEGLNGSMAGYYGLLSFGDTQAQPGADLNAMWYLRNAKIFAKLMHVAEPGDRVLVVYGAGHNTWLRHFASEAAGYENVDPLPYLERAALGVAAARK